MLNSKDFLYFRLPDDRVNVKRTVGVLLINAAKLIELNYKKCISDPLRFGPGDSDGNGVIPHPGHHSWLQLFLC